MWDRIIVEASGNIIKNVKSVVVPNTGGRCGIEAAAAIGALGGDENAQLQVIAGITDAVTEGKRARQLSLPRPCGLSSLSGKTGRREADSVIFILRGLQAMRQAVSGFLR